jgi:hypothetical protein
MTKSRSRAAALAGLTVGPRRNEDERHPFQPKYSSEENADPKTMTPSPVFETDGVKRYVRRVAFTLATLPLLAAAALMIKSIL